jgi:hypothetical protein
MNALQRGEVRAYVVPPASAVALTSGPAAELNCVVSGDKISEPANCSANPANCVAARSPERRRSPRNRNALQRFGDRRLAVSVPSPSAFTLTPEAAAELCFAGSQPGMPCRIRSAFFDGVMWP